mgnify:CR=1 FL=1
MRNAAARGAGALLIIAPGVQQMPRAGGAKHPEDAETAMRVANAPWQGGAKTKTGQAHIEVFHAAARMGEAHCNAPCRDESAARVGMERKK